jgi:hypothetical protein
MITELTKMLIEEQTKINKKIAFFENLKQCKNIIELKKYLKENNIHHKHSHKNNKIEIGVMADFWIAETIYLNDAFEDNFKRFLKFPLKYKQQIDFLLTGNNIDIAINEYINYNNICEMAKKTKRKNNQNFMGCMIDKFLREQYELLEKKYYWLFVRDVSKIENLPITENELILNIFQKIIDLQNEIWKNKLSHEIKENLIAENKIKIQNLLSEIQ